MLLQSHHFKQEIDIEYNLGIKCISGRVQYRKPFGISCFRTTSIATPSCRSHSPRNLFFAKSVKTYN